MAQSKVNGVSVTSQLDVESTNVGLSPEKKGTADDQRDMFRMGKHQQLRVGISPWSNARTDNISETFASCPSSDSL